MPVTPTPVKESHVIKTVALVGNPNSGKTTLFNAFTRLRQKVGNYPGVTVEKKSGKLVLANDRVINVVDLPGTYSLSVRSPDEQVVRDVLMGRMEDAARPDMIVCVVDASNLERHLYLVSQVQDLQIPMVVVLNMVDEAEEKGMTIDAEKLSKGLGVPVVPMVANKDIGVGRLKELIAGGVEVNYERKWKMAPDLEEEVEHIVRLIMARNNVERPQAFVEALIMMALGSRLKTDPKAKAVTRFYQEQLIEQIHKVQERLKQYGLRARTEAIEARYDWIKSVLKDVIRKEGDQKVSATEKIDSVLTHRVWGWVSFVGLMVFMFYMIFTIAAYPMGWIDTGFARLGTFAGARLPSGIFTDLLVNGIIAGVGGVVVFLPQILILFLFIGFLQDTGYMARASFIMDRMMTRFGLHGKSFIPLLSSFACAIPGIMASRTIENPKDRLVTILVAPLMSCSARLPVYAIMIAVLIPHAASWQKAGIMFLMYLLGIIGACGMALLFKKTLLRSQRPVFIMELPPYRLPSFKSLMIYMWERSRMFVKRAGTVILGMSIVLWALMSFPRHADMPPSQALQHSYAGQIGQMMEPAIKPLGFDWRIGIGLVGSMAAREVFVSTMSIVFNLDGSTSGQGLQKAFAVAHWPDGRPLFTPLVCLSLMVFYVFALQCMSTIAVVHRETNSLLWPAFQFVYMGILAYCMAFLTYQGGRLLGFA